LAENDPAPVKRKYILRIGAPSVHLPEIAIPSAGAYSATLQSSKNNGPLCLRVSEAVAPSALTIVSVSRCFRSETYGMFRIRASQ